MPYLSYYSNSRSFFVPKRCSYCIDQCNELADVSFGDIHIKPYKEDLIGVNSLIIRTEKFWDLILVAKKQGVLTLNEIEATILKSSQPMIKYKKQRNATAIEISSFFGYAVPEYDISMYDPNKLKSIISFFITRSQQFIGNHKSLWFLIKILKERQYNK